MSKKLIPLLYHIGNNVRVAPYEELGQVVEIVMVGNTFLCPHCGYIQKLQAGCGSHYAYFLDIPHPNATCCTPFRHQDLMIHEETIGYAFHLWLHCLKKGTL